ncbi:MAG: FtsL-like putative cell division protein [Bacteroidota bacterium]
MRENRKYENKIKNSQEQSSAEDFHVHEPPIEVKENNADEPLRAIKKSHKGRKAVQEFLGGDYLSKETVAGNIGYILFLGFLTMIFISNTYYTEKIFKTIDRTKSELKELRYQYITTKSILMFQGRQSEISKRAIGLGLKESKIPPYKIQYSGESLKPTGK